MPSRVRTESCQLESRPTTVGPAEAAAAASLARRRGLSELWRICNFEEESNQTRRRRTIRLFGPAGSATLNAGQLNWSYKVGGVRPS